jgi:hypothetical protein
MKLPKVFVLIFVKGISGYLKDSHALKADATNQH